MPFEVIVPKGSPPPLAPYSPGAKAGNAVYVSGTLALDSEGKLVGAGDVKTQTRQLLETIKSVLEAAGGSLKDVTFNHIFLTDMTGYADMNEVYREYFPDESTGALLHPRRPRKTGILGRDRVDRASEPIRSVCRIVRRPGWTICSRLIRPLRIVSPLWNSSLRS